MLRGGKEGWGGTHAPYCLTTVATCNIKIYYSFKVQKSASAKPNRQPYMLSIVNTVCNNKLGIANFSKLDI